MKKNNSIEWFEKLCADFIESGGHSDLRAEIKEIADGKKTLCKTAERAALDIYGLSARSLALCIIRDLPCCIGMGLKRDCRLIN